MCVCVQERGGGEREGEIERVHACTCMCEYCNVEVCHSELEPSGCNKEAAAILAIAI